MNAMDKMIAARAVMLLDEPFIGSLALSLKLVEDRRCKTAWVDGRSIGFNPKFVDGLTSDQIKALVFHETMHPALGHCWRRDGRDPHKFNIACDKVINHEAREAGYTLPDGAWYAEGDEIGKSAEWIFAHMAEQGDEPGEDEGEPGEDEGDGDGGAGKGDDEGDEGEGDGGTGDEPGGDGDGDGEDEGDGDGDGTGGDGDPLGELRDAPTGPDGDGDDAPSEQDWKEKVAQAASYAQSMGKLPAGMARLVREALKPRVDVRSLLLRFFQERAKSDYSWTRPNTRYVPQGLYLPALHSTALGEVAIMVDTSGSVDDVALADSRAIVSDVLAECDPLGVTLYFADADVQHIQRMEKGEPLTWEPQGGGGTDFRPALARIEEDGTPVCVVCISDLVGTFPAVPPNLPVLWLSTVESNIAPFGETVFVGK